LHPFAKRLCLMRVLIMLEGILIICFNYQSITRLLIEFIFYKHSVWLILCDMIFYYGPHLIYVFVILIFLSDEGSAKFLFWLIENRHRNKCAILNLYYFCFNHSSSYQMQLSHSDQNSSLPTVPNQPASIASSLQQLFSN
jgi:hypothetical protein